MSEGVATVVEASGRTAKVETLGHRASIETKDGTAAAVIQRAAATVVQREAAATVSMLGRQGMAGTPGSRALDHLQLQAQRLWTIAHNLGARPGVSVFTLGGVMVDADVRHLSENVLTIGFAVPVAGYAHII